MLISLRNTLWTGRDTLKTTVRKLKILVCSILDYMSDVDLNDNMLCLTSAKTNTEGLHSIKAGVWMPQDLDIEPESSEDELLAENNRPEKIVASNRWAKIESMF